MNHRPHRRSLIANTLRWQTESYFKTLEMELGTEKLKYETFDRYFAALSLFMIVG